MNAYLNLFVVYFIYGLVFFSMGLVVLIELQRIPATAPQVRFLRPLCLFGFLHSLNEWLEMLLIAFEPIPSNTLVVFGWLRLIILIMSFIALWIYGLETLRYARPKSNFLTRFGRLTLPIYAALVLVDVIFAFSRGQISVFQAFSSLTRYILAVPAAAIATIGLHAAACKARDDDRLPLDAYLNGAAAGFAVYSLTQLFVPPMDTMLAGIINADQFASWIGFPIQALRTVVALLITYNIFRAVNFLEKERQVQLEHAQLEHLKALEQQETLRRELLQHTVRAQEEERAHIARELHDELAQILTAISLDLGTLQNDLSENSKYTPILKRLQDLSRNLSQSMYRIVAALRPAHLDDLGLEAALRYLLEEDFRRRGLAADIEIVGPSRRVEPLVETVLFRVAQEALTNTQRYAQATQTRVCLCYEKESVRLRVSDNGKVFDPTQSFTAPHGWGLAGMKERAESMGGRFLVESAPSKGTVIEVSIPCRDLKGAG